MCISGILCHFHLLGVNRQTISQPEGGKSFFPLTASTRFPVTRGVTGAAINCMCSVSRETPPALAGRSANTGRGELLTAFPQAPQSYVRGYLHAPW